MKYLQNVVDLFLNTYMSYKMATMEPKIKQFLNFQLYAGVNYGTHV